MLLRTFEQKFYKNGCKFGKGLNIVFIEIKM